MDAMNYGTGNYKLLPYGTKTHISGGHVANNTTYIGARYHSANTKLYLLHSNVMMHQLLSSHHCGWIQGSM